MTIDEAVEILHEIDEARPTVDLYYWREAVQLGIEALKRCKEARSKGTIWNHTLLSGETT